MKSVGMFTFLSLVAGCAAMSTIRVSPRPTKDFPEPWAEETVQAPTAVDTPQPASPRSATRPSLSGMRLAVLEFEGKGLGEEALMIFSDAIRAGALDGLESSGVSVMTRENMLLLIKEMGQRECVEGACEVETARNIGADYVVSARVARMERVLIAVLKLHETKGGTLLATENVEAKSQVELMRALRQRARRIVEKALVAGAVGTTHN